MIAFHDIIIFQVARKVISVFFISYFIETVVNNFFNDFLFSVSFQEDDLELFEGQLGAEFEQFSGKGNLDDKKEGNSKSSDKKSDPSKDRRRAGASEVTKDSLEKAIKNLNSKKQALPSILQYHSNGCKG